MHQNTPKTNPPSKNPNPNNLMTPSTNFLLATFMGIDLWSQLHQAVTCTTVPLSVNITEWQKTCFILISLLIRTYVKPLAGTRNSSMGPPWEINQMTHCTITRCSITELCLKRPHLLVMIPWNQLANVPDFSSMTWFVWVHHEGSIRWPIAQ